MSLDSRYDTNNVFAKILRGEMPVAEISQTAETLAFMDAFPQSRGHCLVVSKTAKSVNLLDLPETALVALAKETQRVAQAVVDALSPDGFRVMQFNGAGAGQTVFHTHFHILPQWEDQPMGGHGQGQADIADLERLATLIAGKLRHA